MELVIDLEQWIQAVGPAAVAMAYVQLENDRRLDEWQKLLAPDAVYTAAFDGKMPANTDLNQRVRDVLSEHSADQIIEIKWIHAISSQQVVFEIKVEGTLETKEEFRLDAIVKFDLDKSSKIEQLRVYYFQPAVGHSLVEGLRLVSNKNTDRATQ